MSQPATDSQPLTLPQPYEMRVRSLRRHFIGLGALAAVAVIAIIAVAIARSNEGGRRARASRETASLR